jgi:hypothetical protein
MMLGFVYLYEHRTNISKGHKGQVPWIKGKTHSEEVRKKIGEASRQRTGFKLSDEHKENLRKAWVRRKRKSLNECAV